MIRDSDGGRWDADVEYDRAVGPMQFIPGTWRAVGVDADGDGRADPNNVFDAATSAARYLCLGSSTFATPEGAQAAILRYNHSAAYVATVLAWANAYANGHVSPTELKGDPGPSPTTTPSVDTPAPVETPPGETPAGETPPAETPPGETPPGETPAGETPPAETPPGETPPGETPPGETPPGETPPGETPPGETPPGETPPGETPPGETPPGETPPGETPPGNTPPGNTPPG
jgi:hypothetical protein